MKLTVQLLRMAGLAFAALLPSAARADAVLNECSQTALESALLVGGHVTVNCDGTLVLTNTITIATDAVLDATGHRLTISSLTGTNATNAVRLFNVNPGVRFSLTNLTLADGRATNGGAIYNNRGFLTLDGCSFSNNLARGADGRGGARGDDGDFLTAKSGRAGANGRGAFGGAVYNFHGTTIVSRCSFLTNAAIAGAGGAGGDGGDGLDRFTRGGNGGNGGTGAKAQGGAIFNVGHLSIANSTFMLNAATGGAGGVGGTNGSGFATSYPGHGGGGAGAGGGAIFNQSGSTLLVHGSTFVLNGSRAGDSASAGGQRAFPQNGKNGPTGTGGAIANQGAISLVNSTFFANKSAGGAAGNGAAADIRGGRGGDGGTAWGGNVYSAKRAAVTNCTFYDGGAVGGSNGLAGVAAVAGKNGRAGASRGGNIANGNGSFLLKNSIIAFPLPGANGYGAFSDQGYNISSDGSIRLKGPGSRTKTDPRIGLLGRNGGFTETIPLFSDSPAIDAGDPAGHLLFDQRGVSRPLGARGDIGAYEYGLTLSAPVITSQPLAQIAQAGATITFIVVTDGDPPLTYQWRRGGTAISGATGPVLTLVNVQTADAASYDVVVSNNSGSVTSAGAALTLINRVAITQHPVGTNVLQGQTVVFRVTATGDAPISYQWIYNRTNLIPGANLATYTLPNVATNQAGEYSVVVFNSFSEVISTHALLIVQTVAPAVTVQPLSLTVLPDATAFFTVEASGSLPLRFLWYRNGTNLVGNFLLDSNRSTLLITNAQPANAGSYHAVVTNISGSATSDAVPLAVAAFPPSLSQQPVDINVAQGQIATFSVTAAGTSPLSYQWFFNDTTRISGATGPVLTIPNAGDANVGSYHVVVSNRFGMIASLPATLSVTFTPPEITNQPVNLTVFSGENATFTVAATGSLPLSFQWFMNDILIEGASSPSLTITNARLADIGDYYVMIVNPAGTTNSEIATLIVEEAAPEITLQPTGGEALLGSNFTFTASVTGSQPLVYQWYFNETNLLARATNSTLVVSNLTTADAGVYSVTITNELGSVDSDIVTPTLLAPFILSCTTSEPIICTLTFDSEEGADYTLQWFDPGTEEWMTIETKSGDGLEMEFVDVPLTPAPPAYRILIEVIPPVDEE